MTLVLWTFTHSKILQNNHNNLINKNNKNNNKNNNNTTEPNRDANAGEYARENLLHERIWSHLVFILLVSRQRCLDGFSPTSAQRENCGP